MAATVGSRVRRLRRSLKLTQERLAELVGVRTNTIYRLEADLIARPTPSNLNALASALETTPAKLLGKRSR